MRVQTLPTPELGNRSYVVDDGTVAVVIDPQRDLDRVERLLDGIPQGPAYVVETHVHNDYVTGGFELARRTGAEYGVSAADEVAFRRLPLRDGQVLTAGSLEVTVLATPGHTGAHLAYLVRDRAAGGPAALFSGGSLLYGTVGRTDLISPEQTRPLTAAQYRSARRLGELEPDTRLYPTHGFGSFCSAAAGTGVEASTIGEELRVNAALTEPSQERFVELLVASLSAYPSYYEHMAPLNRQGPGAAELTSLLTSLTPDELAARIAAGDLVVDLRPADAFAGLHLAGTISVNLGNQFATYVGWLAPWGGPLTVIGEREADLEVARRDLARIGFDGPAAAWGTLDQLAPASVERRSYRRATFADLIAERDASDAVLDVRRDDEYKVAHVDGAIHIPLHELAGRIEEVPSTRVWVYCAGGFRAGTAASIIDAHGGQVVQIDDGFDRFLELTS